MVDAATRIDTTARQVELFSGPPLPYDYLIYAVAAAPLRLPFREPTNSLIPSPISKKRSD